MTALTGTDIKARVLSLFGDTAGVQVADTDIVAWINDAQREIYMQHEGLAQKTSNANSVAGTGTYALPADLLTLQSVSYKDTVTGSFYDLRFLSSEDLDQQFNDWNTSSGSPAFYSRGETQGQLLILPIPDSSVANGIKYVYSRYSTDIAAIASPLDVPEYYHQTVLEYCLMKAYELDENWEASDRKSDYVQSTIDFNNSRDGWFGHETFPTISPLDEDNW